MHVIGSNTTVCTSSEMSSILTYLTSNWVRPASCLPIMKNLEGCSRVHNHYQVPSESVWEWLKATYGPLLVKRKISDIHVLIHASISYAERNSEIPMAE